MGAAQLRELPSSQALGIAVTADAFPPLVYGWGSCLGCGSLFSLGESSRLEVKDALVSGISCMDQSSGFGRWVSSPTGC